MIPAKHTMMVMKRNSTTTIRRRMSLTFSRAPLLSSDSYAYSAERARRKEREIQVEKAGWPWRARGTAVRRSMMDWVV